MNTSQKAVEQFVHERGWEKQLPDHVAKSITIEAAELLEIFQWSNPTAKEIKRNLKQLSLIKGELADVLIYSLHLANILGLNAETIVEEKLAFAAKKYPSELMKRRSKGDSLATIEYLEIKNAYRAKKIKK
ncbi:MAG: MazG-like family protein [bacterium]|nr:MazG-like family protein [bacterium]